jgi:cell division protein FtsQ
MCIEWFHKSSTRSRVKSLKRPPSRSGSKQQTAKVVPLFPKRIRQAPKPVKAPVSKQVIRKQAKRLDVAERLSKASVAKLRPRVAFGRRVILASSVSVLLLAALVVVAVVSPLLAVREIEIVGTNRVSATSILKDLKYLKGKPLPQITSEELANKLGKYELIDSVSAVALPPSKLRVVVVERSAIAIVSINNVPYLYDAAGVQLGRAGNQDHLPVIHNAGNPSSSVSFTSAVSVLLSFPVELLPKVQSVVAGSKDNVVLSLRSYNQKIFWGDASDPALKAKVLNALMKHYANHFGATFDVSSPSQPSVY